MTVQPTLSTLQLDCLLSILSYVPLAECLPLRMTCHYLKAAVEEYFRDSVRALPVLLSARYMPEDVARYNRFYEDYRSWERTITEYEEIVLGSSVSQWKSWEDKHIFRSQKGHFRRSDYLVLWDIPKFDSLVSFIAHYFPNITKLALVVDHEAHMFSVSEVLNIYRKQLKVLVLEMTGRVKRNEQTINYPKLRLLSESTCPKSLLKFDRFSPDFFHAIDALEALEELYFFAKNSFTFIIERSWNSEERQFVDRMLRKLQVLHINCPCKYLHENGDHVHFRPRVYLKIKELACHSFHCLYNRYANHRFPNLEKCFLLEEHRYYHLFDDFLEDINVEFMPNLKELRYQQVNFTPEWLNTLHTFPKLEKIYCNGLMIFLRYLDLEQLRQIKQNRSVKFIETDKLFIPPENNRPETDIAGEIAIFSRAFQKGLSFKWNILSRST